MEYELKDNEKARQYEFHIDGLVPRIEYIRSKEKIFLTHTEVPSALKGKGVGFELVRQALLYIKRRDLTLVPLCPFVATYIKRHPEWKELVLKGINIE